MKKIYCIAMLLVLIGAINWGLIGLFDFNLVYELFDLIGNPANSFLSLLHRIIYIAVGVAGVLLLLCHLGKCGKGSCDKPAAAPPAE